MQAKIVRQQKNGKVIISVTREVTSEYVISPEWEIDTHDHYDYYMAIERTKTQDPLTTLELWAIIERLIQQDGKKLIIR